LLRIKNLPLLVEQALLPALSNSRSQINKPLYALTINIGN
jgi:hypothetical protein